MTFLGSSWEPASPKVPFYRSCFTTGPTKSRTQLDYAVGLASGLRFQVDCSHFAGDELSVMFAMIFPLATSLRSSLMARLISLSLAFVMFL
jgi:hypothetical protein